MPTRQLPSGRWQARIWNNDKQGYVSIGTWPTEKEAKIGELRFEAGLEDTPPATPKRVPKGREKFGKFALEVIQSRKHLLSPSTYHYHLWNLKAHLTEFENIAIADITYTQVAKWWMSMEDKANTRKSVYGTLSSVMRRAVKLGLIPSSPCMIEGATKDFSKPRPTHHAADVRMLLMMCTDEQMKVALLMLLHTGMRVGELLALTWEDIDLQQGTVDVHRHLTIHGIQEGTKSHPEGRRVLYMPQEATECVLRLYDTRKALPTAFVFLNTRGGLLTYHKFRERFVALRDACGLDDLNIHDLRHIHLTEYSRNGATLKEVMTRAGHSDVESALRYQHSSTEREKELVERMQL